jgi:hypothetical protein
MRCGGRVLALVSLSVALVACDSDDTLEPGGDQGDDGRTPTSVVQASGDLTAALTEFRGALGEPANGGGSGPQPAGRREIKWDGVPAELTNVDTFPADGFRNAGLITTTDGIGTRVSDNDFADINPTYGEEFESLSKPKTFMAAGSRNMTLTFRVPGTDTGALVSGIGIVFSDVDRAGAATITLYAADGTSLGEYAAPARTDASGHSFVGVAFDRPIVARVEVRSGEAALSAGANDLSDGGLYDLVVTDDFLFGEPQPAS